MATPSTLLCAADAGHSPAHPSYGVYVGAPDKPGHDEESENGAVSGLDRGRQRVPQSIGRHGRSGRRAVLASAAAGLMLGPARLLAQAAEPLRIGAVVSQTGPAAAFGKDWAQGFDAYTINWNNRGGHKGRRIALESLDDESNPAGAVNAYRRLVSDPRTVAVWLALSAQTAMGIKAISTEFRVPTVSGGGLEALGRPPAPYFFKLAATAPDFAKTIIEYAKRKGYQKLAILTSNDANGQAEAAGIKAAIDAGGMQLAAAETYAPTDTNFNVQLTRIRNAGVDLFYNGATGNPGILVYRQAKQLQLTMPLAMSVAAVTAAFFQAIGGPANAEGLISALPVGGVVGAATPEGKQELEALQTILGHAPVAFHTFGWEAGLITEWALNNSDGTRDGVREALDRATNIPSINGPITFKPDNHIGQDMRGVVVARLEGGVWRTVN